MLFVEELVYFGGQRRFVPFCFTLSYKKSCKVFCGSQIKRMFLNERDKHLECSFAYFNSVISYFTRTFS